MSTSSILPIVQFEQVGKRFDFHSGGSTTILESLANRFSRKKRLQQQADHDFWAVNDVSFDIMPGESVGIIGKNGSGKSTALKLMTHILHPTTGKVTVRGHVSALLELGTGFHPDLTGRENIFLNAAILGLQKETVAEQYEKIVAFSELGEFIDMPVKHYSSGMYMRLGFSVAIHLNPDLLIVDEILAVGDQNFQGKCLDKIHDMQRDGVTLIMVSHNLDVMRKMCTRLIWMDKGNMLADGIAEEVADEYDSFAADDDVALILETESNEKFKRSGSREAEITAVRILDSDGNVERRFKTHDSLVVEMDYIAHEEIKTPEFRVAIYREDGFHINDPNTHVGGLDIKTINGTGTVRYTIPDLPLMPARYLITTAIHNAHAPRTYDYHEQAYTFRVIPGGAKRQWGAIEIAANWNISPGSA